MATAVELVPYDRRWPEDFERIRDKLQRLLAPYVMAIEHIGSTSIPGIVAKPLIDIDIILRSSADVPPATQILLRENYEPRGNRYDDDVWAFHAARLQAAGTNLSLPTGQSNTRTTFDLSRLSSDPPGRSSSLYRAESGAGRTPSP